MKKILCSLIAVLTLFSSVSVVSAANVGDVIGYTMYTDIIASINNHNIASFNIDGYTGVVAEDLRNYGFDVQWVPESKALYITRGTTNTVASTYVANKIPASMVGAKAQDILFTDIKCYINGTEVQSYNINGQTIVNFNDLQAFGIVTYNNDTRKLDLTVSDGLALRPDSWYQNLPKITMYAVDGRTTEVFAHEAAAYADVGWYYEPMEKLYALDGREIVVSKSEVDAYLAVGWYISPVSSSAQASSQTGQSLHVDSKKNTSYGGEWSSSEISNLNKYGQAAYNYADTAGRHVFSARIKYDKPKSKAFFLNGAIDRVGDVKLYVGKAKEIADSNAELPDYPTVHAKQFSTIQERIDYVYKLCDEIIDLEITASNYTMYIDKIDDVIKELQLEIIGIHIFESDVNGTVKK